jgi:hypothetical protein
VLCSETGFHASVDSAGRTCRMCRLSSAAIHETKDVEALVVHFVREMIECH